MNVIGKLLQHGRDPVPPHALDAEGALIGAMLFDPDVIDAARVIARPEDFYAHIHGTIVRVIYELRDVSAPADSISVSERLRAHGQLEAVGGLTYLSRCMESVQTVGSATYYARLVREKAALRGLISAGTNIAELGYGGESEIDVPGTLEQAERIVREVTQRGTRVSGGQTTLDLVRAVYTEFDTHTGAQRTPWPYLDGLTGGFFPGELIVWAAAPKIGKSGVVLGLADYTAQHDGPVLFFSLEMPPIETMRRLIAMYSGVSARDQRIGSSVLGPVDFERISAATNIIGERPLQVFGRPQCVRDVRAIVARAQRDHGHVASVVIDHVGFLTDANARNDDRESKHERMDRIYTTLLGIAQEYGCTMHVVQHVNREGAKRLTPTLSDLRDGGNLEGHAHVIVFPWRSHPTVTDQRREDGKLIVAANRQGEPGEVAMRYIGYRHLWLQAAQRRPWFESFEPEPEEDAPLQFPEIA